MPASDAPEITVVHSPADGAVSGSADFAGTGVASANLELRHAAQPATGTVSPSMPSPALFSTAEDAAPSAVNAAASAAADLAPFSFDDASRAAKATSTTAAVATTAAHIGPALFSSGEFVSGLATAGCTAAQDLPGVSSSAFGGQQPVKASLIFGSSSKAFSASIRPGAHLCASVAGAERSSGMPSMGAFSGGAPGLPPLPFGTSTESSAAAAGAHTFTFGTSANNSSFPTEAGGATPAFGKPPATHSAFSQDGTAAGDASLASEPKFGFGQPSGAFGTAATSTGMTAAAAAGPFALNVGGAAFGAQRGTATPRSSSIGSDILAAQASGLSARSTPASGTFSNSIAPGSAAQISFGNLGSSASASVIQGKFSGTAQPPVRTAVPLGTSTFGGRGGAFSTSASLFGVQVASAPQAVVGVGAGGAIGVPGALGVVFGATVGQACTFGSSASTPASTDLLSAPRAAAAPPLAMPGAFGQAAPAAPLGAQPTGPLLAGMAAPAGSAPRARTRYRAKR